MKKIQLLAMLAGALLSVTLSLTACADSAEANIKKTLQKHLGAGTPIETISKTPYSGLYEVKIGAEIVYTDAEGKYIFIGRIVEAESSKDLTEARLEEVNKIKFTDLPLDLAAKSVKGNGKRVIAVFEDPNCGYCKRFRKTLNDKVVEIGRKLGVSGTPTVFFTDGTRVPGALDSKKLEAKLASIK